MKRLLFLFSIFAASFLISCKNDIEGEIKLVTPEEMQALMELEDVQLVDVRTAQERVNGFIKNSQNIDFTSPTFEEDIEKLDKTKPVILYCHSGGRSEKCAKKLKDAGFEMIYDLKGGISQWRFKELHIEMPN
ncbi:rhodanese-like domain-containing protein [Gelidibacter salicanalis]|uniref:Rhodanese-like domain-containing protein n=1 Tax=Gelidibacter salicanalis TaxID=291193 RepID=A0A934NIQ0_9FLAO|nr:rhodanese-like domain-containing protein [Gelidibacter salicanalis]MBJ7882406.1 rhodanese-like domain-containing protein [Gelidibacter salicanalis]